MVVQRFKACLTASCLFVAIAQSMSAELPMLDDPPWWGYYAVHAGKSYQFKIVSADGKGALVPIVGAGDPVGENLVIHISFAIVETLPDGKTIMRAVRVETLESADPATEKLSKSLIRAKTDGDASLEITIEQARGMIFIGSRVMDSGTLANPLRCSISADFPNSNSPSKAVADTEEVNDRAAERAAKKETKAAEKKLKEDCVDLKWTDGKRQKITFEKTLDAGSKEINGPGISAAEIKIAAYGGRKFVFNASANSAMKLSNIKPASLSEGFSIQWSPDPDTNKDGKARLAFEVK